MPAYSRTGERVYRGIPVSPGVCRGKILVLGRKPDSIVKRRLPEDELPAEIRRLESALGRTREQVLEVQRKVTEAMGAKDASIFDAHLLVLEDPVLIDEVSRIVMNDQVNVEYAFQEFTERYAETLSRMNDEYLKERVSDMRDVASRVLNNLLGRENLTGLPQLTEPAIVISHDLAPSVTAQLDKHLVIGFATDVGSKTSHTAIMARSLRIPAVVGLTRASEHLESGEYALLDGYNGMVIINPTDQTLFEYGQLARRQLRIEEKLRDLRNEPAVTLDGNRVVLSANIEQADDARAVQECGAQGVGLFRTEYLFINRESLPSEEEQYRAYRQIAAALNPHPVVVRTLDLGGDKFLSHLQVPAEMNPFLGWRAIRFCLQERAIFRDQIRAILRAGAEGNVKMMYPMISGLDELRQANRLVDEIKRELAAEELPHDDHMEIGVMVEIPSAALTADSLAQHAGFFSVGTNDLIQYTLAVDRLNEKIAHLYEPTHPAILRLIKLTVDAAHQRGIWAGVCGEMAAELALVPLLLGLGVDELSVTPSSVPQVKYLIRRLKMNEARELADFALNCSSPAEILERSQSLATRITPSLFENQSLTS